jgi:hypothetical protein
MTTDKYVATLKQIQALVSEALGQPQPPKIGKKAHAKSLSRHSGHLSFNMNILAFMNKYARGKSGPQKFTLLIAYLVKGGGDAQASIQDIKNHWNKMKTVLEGPFNPAHGNRAKAKGWVEPEKKGMWKLTDSWKEALT